MRHAFSRCLLWIALAGLAAAGIVPQAHADLPYQVSITVKDDSKLEETLRSASLLVAQEPSTCRWCTRMVSIP